MVLAGCAVLLGGCGSGYASTVSDDVTDSREELVILFNQGIAGDASCADLFVYRNVLDVETSTFYDSKLREIGCVSSTSERTDKPSPDQPAVLPTLGISQSTTTLQRAATDEFMQFLRTTLVGTSYSIESQTTPFGKAQVETLTYLADNICCDLGAGTSESQMREELAENEKLGDPSLDKDIPMFVEAIFSAATIYVCP